MDSIEGLGESSSSPRNFGSFNNFDLRNDVFNRLVETGHEEAITNPDFRDQLDSHFNRLPVRYGLDVNIDRVKDVLLAKDPEKRPVYHIRFMENISKADDVDEDDQEFISVLTTPRLSADGANDGVFSHKRNQASDVEPCSKLEDLNLDVKRSSKDIEEHTMKFSKRQDNSYVPEVILSTIDKPKLLSQLSTFLADIGLNIHEAHVFSTADGYFLDVFVVDGRPIEDADDLCDAMEQGNGRSEGSWFRSSHSHPSMKKSLSSPIKLGDRIASGSCGDLEVQHENVVRFIGACTKFLHFCIVTEYKPGESLYDYLHKNDTNNPSSSTPQKTTTDSPPIYRLPSDALHQIFASLPLRQIIISRSVCKAFNALLSSPSFLCLIPTTSSLRLLALRPPHHHNRHNRHNRHLSPLSTLHAFDPDRNEWLRFPLDFLPFRSLHPVAAARGLVFFWGESNDATCHKSLVVLNPLTRRFRVLPQLGSAWSRHGSVLVDHEASRVMVLTELAALLYFTSNSNQWLNFSSNLPSKPRSPILIGDSVYALCDVGSPWRSQWKLFSCSVGAKPSSSHQSWNRLERHEWGDVFDILKRPRLVRGTGNRVLMVGGLKSSFSLNSAYSTILILRLELGSLEWDEAGRMPGEMFRCFQESSKFKVFGAGDSVCFSAKRLGRLALWDCRGGAKSGEWRWIDGVPGAAAGDGWLCRGFVLEAGLTAL